jgi:hypothetical protein
MNKLGIEHQERFGAGKLAMEARARPAFLFVGEREKKEEGCKVLTTSRREVDATMRRMISMAGIGVEIDGGFR